MVVSGSYDDTTQKIILTLKNGQTVEFSVADLVSGLQSEITLSNKLDADLVSDVSSENKFVTAAEKATWNSKQDAISDLSTIRSGASKGDTAVQPSDMEAALADKQDTISDLSTIRSGAALGATALQQSDVTSTYSASGTAPVNGTAVNAAIGMLNVLSVGGSGKYISEISEENGKISATPETMDTVPTSGSTKAVTSGGVQAPLAEVVDAGAKNEFDPASAFDSKTAYGVTITRNGDTFSIASGTTQSGDNNFINMGYQANTNLIPAGDWVLSFDTPQQNVRFQVCWNGTLQANASFGNNLFFTVPENTTDSWFRILLKGSTNMAGTSFKIMLCPRVFWEISQSFQPYRPSWQKMYEMIQELQNNS